MSDFDKQIADIYREMELHIIQSMKRNLALHIAEEEKTGIKYPQWQAIKLKELKRYQRQNKRIVDKYTRGLPKDIARHMKDELDQGAMSQFRLYKEALGAGYKSSRLMKESFFKVDDRAVSALIDSLQNDMATANTAVLRMVNDVYRETIFKSAMFVKNGVYTEKQAYDMAVKSFLEKGINCIQYKDGRRVNIVDYAEMAVRTASQRAHMAGQGEFRKEIGRTLILISRHNTACELCKPFEHKVLIDDVYSGGKPEDGDYMLLSEAMKQGLYHPRCRHGSGTYYPELEEINHYESEDNRLNEYGDEKINAAHVDNMIQKYKRLALGSTLSENIAKYNEKLKYWESLKRPEKVDNIAESGIIINTKVIGDTVLNPMNKERYIKMKDGLAKSGIKVIQAKDDDLRYLQHGLNAEASYGHGYIMHIGEIPSASAMFEETIHSTQAKIYGEFKDDDIVELCAREIAANRKLLKHKKAYGFTPKDEEEISKNLSLWEKNFRKVVGISYDKSSIKREI